MTRIQQVADVFDRSRSPTWRQTAEQLDSLAHASTLKVSEDLEGAAGIDPGLTATDLTQALEDAPRMADMLL